MLRCTEKPTYIVQLSVEVCHTGLAEVAATGRSVNVQMQLIQL